MSKTRSRYTLLNKPAMATKHHADGYQSFCELIQTFKNNEVIYVYFEGSKLPNGQSWCPDCNEANSVVEAGLKKADSKAHFVYVEVGDRTYWKDQKCPFKTDPRTRLMTIPTLMRWPGPNILNSEQCKNPDLVEMIFTES